MLRRDLIREFSREYETRLPANEMAVAVDALKTHIAKKPNGFSVDCFVLYKGIDACSNELNDFLQQLKTNIKNYPNNTVLQ